MGASSRKKTGKMEISGWVLVQDAPPFKNSVSHSDARPGFYNSVNETYKKHRDDVPHWTKAKHKTLYPVILEARKTNLKVERDHPGKDWATIWKRTLCTKLTNKQRMLNFKIVHSVLHTGYRWRKQAKDPGICPHCAQMETIKHLFTLVQCGETSGCVAQRLPSLGLSNNANHLIFQAE